MRAFGSAESRREITESRPALPLTSLTLLLTKYLLVKGLVMKSSCSSWQDLKLQVCCSDTTANLSKKSALNCSGEIGAASGMTPLRCGPIQMNRADSASETSKAAIICSAMKSGEIKFLIRRPGRRAIIPECLVAQWRKSLPLLPSKKLMA